MGRPSKAKDEISSRSCEQLDPRSSQDNYAAMSYSGLVILWFWPYPSYYTPLDYSRMYIQLYYNQYPSMYLLLGMDWTKSKSNWILTLEFSWT